MSEALRPVWVDSGAGVAEIARRCRKATAFSLDTEADSMYAYFHKVCLVQVTVAGRHFLLDPLELGREGMVPLAEVLAEPSIEVVLHGADYDLRVLDRDLGARIRGLRDTQVMAQLAGEARTGLANLLEQELGIQLDKRFQRADWGRRPLSPAMLEYAAADTAYVGRLAAILRRRLEEAGRWTWALEEFAALERVRHVPVDPDPLAFERIKGARKVRGKARDRLFTLFLWRDERARELDRPPFKVLGNRELLALSESPPAEIDELADTPGVGPRIARRWGPRLLELLRRPEAAPPRARFVRSGAGPDKERMKALLSARDEIAKELGLEPGLVCPRATAEAVVGCAGKSVTVKDLERCGLVGWRLDLLGGPFATVLEGDGGDEGRSKGQRVEEGPRPPG